MTTATLVQEQFASGHSAVRVYFRGEGVPWGFQATDLQGSPYSESAREYTEIGTIEIPAEDLDAGDFADFGGAIKKNRVRLQAVSDLHFRGTSSRLIV
jgi:hypothetical protein